MLKKGLIKAANFYMNSERANEAKYYVGSRIELGKKCRDTYHHVGHIIRSTVLSHQVYTCNYPSLGDTAESTNQSHDSCTLKL